MAHDPFNELPPMNRLLAHPSTERLLVQFNMENVVQGCRDILDDLRRAINEGFAIDPAALEADAILDRVESRLAAASRVGLQRVVNASGVVLHPYLGRALLPQPAVDTLVRAATQPLNLEYDLAQGDRGPREETIADLLMEDRHDLIHKATGWMLREAGKKNQKQLESFIKKNCSKIPRTTLRYAIEKFSENKRKNYLNNVLMSNV